MLIKVNFLRIAAVMGGGNLLVINWLWFLWWVSCGWNRKDWCKV